MSSEEAASVVAAPAAAPAAAPLAVRALSSSRRVLAVSGLTFREAWRRKVVIAALVMTAAYLALYAVGLHYAGEGLRDIPPQAAGPLPGDAMRSLIAGQMLYVGLFPASLVIGLIAVLSSAGSISSEIDTGVLHGVVTRPLRRWELVTGKALGLGTMLASYSLGLTLAVIGTAKWQVDPPLMNVPQALALFVLEPLILASLALMLSTRLSTLANGVLCIALYGIAFVGGMVEQIGGFVRNRAMQDIGIVTSLMMPVDAIHRKANALLMPGSLLSGDFGGPFFSSAGQPSVWMLLYAVAYCLLALWTAARWFADRDL